MSLPSFIPMWSPFVSDPRLPRLLLRPQLSSRASNISNSLRCFESLMVELSEVQVNIVNEVSSQWLIEDIPIKVDDLSSELACLEIKDRLQDLLVRMERSDGPRPPNDLLFLLFR